MNLSAGNAFSLTFANIRGIHTNLNPTHHFLQAHKQHILALIETQNSSAASTAPPNPTNHTKLFNHHTNCIDDHAPLCQIIVLGDFNVHNTSWLTHSSQKDKSGLEAETFAILNNLHQLNT